MIRIFTALLFINFCYSQNYYIYVAAESDDTVSVLKFDGENIEETDRVTVGIMPTENEGPHGITAAIAAGSALSVSWQTT